MKTFEQIIKDQIQAVVGRVMLEDRVCCHTADTEYPAEDVRCVAISWKCNHHDAYRFPFVVLIAMARWQMKY